jgi:hypothetical protein
MNNPTIELNRPQLISALSQFSPEALKKVIDDLFRKKLYTPHSLAEITREASTVVRKAKLGPETAEEAVRWARLQK